MKGRNDELARLHALQRWRQLELEEAQAQHVALERITDERQTAVDAAQSVMTQTQSFAREQLGNALLSTDALQRINHFSAAQLRTLESARQRLEESRAETQAAQANVQRRYEERSIVERLRDRRALEAARESVRAAQKFLDEHALLRLSNECRKFNKEEE